MSELTKEYFDQVVKGLATINALHTAVAPLATKQDVREGVEELARMVAEGFEDVQHRLDVQQLIQAHERKFQKLEEALHIKL
jgi:hypothetical protein